MNLNEVSKYISLILRHKPDVININLDSHGYANVDELINGIKKTYIDFDFSVLEEIVATDNKKRYSFSDDKKRIRANQGHSINVDLELLPIEPPLVLYHGTAKKYEKSIDSEGLKSKSRQYVHLSANIEVANTVGKRHGELLVYGINSKEMYDDGYKFYLSVNNVWLTDEVPTKYLFKI